MTDRKIFPLWVLLRNSRESYRCGVFFARQKTGLKPILKIFIIPQAFEATCPAENPKIFEQECKNLVSDAAQMSIPTLEMLALSDSGENKS